MERLVYKYLKLFKLWSLVNIICKLYCSVCDESQAIFLTRMERGKILFFDTSVAF